MPSFGLWDLLSISQSTRQPPMVISISLLRWVSSWVDRLPIFLSLWFDSTGSWTTVSRTDGEYHCTIVLPVGSNYSGLKHTFFTFVYSFHHQIKTSDKFNCKALANTRNTRYGLSLQTRWARVHQALSMRSIPKKMVISCYYCFFLLLKFSFYPVVLTRNIAFLRLCFFSKQRIEFISEVKPIQRDVFFNAVKIFYKRLFLWKTWREIVPSGQNRRKSNL